MKKQILIYVTIALLSACAISKNAPAFKDYGSVEKNQCVLYLMRDKAMLGAAIPWAATIYEFNADKGEFEKPKFGGEFKLLAYKPLVLKSNTLYKILFDSHVFIFSGMEGSESIIKIKGLQEFSACIKKQAIIRTNSESGFNFTNEQLKKWSISLSNSSKYTEASEKKSLMDAEFDILVENPNTILYKEIQNARLTTSGKPLNMEPYK